jgi:hypothetical protein
MSPETDKLGEEIKALLAQKQWRKARNLIVSQYDPTLFPLLDEAVQPLIAEAPSEGRQERIDKLYARLAAMCPPECIQLLKPHDPCMATMLAQFNGFFSETWQTCAFKETHV